MDAIRTELQTLYVQNQEIRTDNLQLRTELMEIKRKVEESEERYNKRLCLADAERKEYIFPRQWLDYSEA
jgi:hypothetical protein